MFRLEQVSSSFQLIVWNVSRLLVVIIDTRYQSESWRSQYTLDNPAPRFNPLKYAYSNRQRG